MENFERPANAGTLIAKGFIYSNIFAIVAFALAYWITGMNEQAGNTLIFAEFVLVPVGMGMISIKFWIQLTGRILSVLIFGVINTLVAIALSAIFLKEGVICLLMVSPLILAFIWVGMLIGKLIFTKSNNTLKASTILVFGAIFLIDTLSDHHHQALVSDKIIINASKEKVWKYIAAYPVNTSEPDYWLFKMGLPNPIQSTVTGETVGAERLCVFSNNAIFREKIVEYKKDSLFTFDILEQPNDPEIIGHINIQRGQFIMEQNQDGTITLTGNSWYSLKVFPSWYFNLWAEDITREVHLRVMKHIKTLAEADV